MNLFVVVGGVALIAASFLTPTWLSHLTWSYRVTRFYRVVGQRGVRYITYNHGKMDGVFLRHRLQKGPLPRVSLRPPTPVCKWVCGVRLSDRGVRESEFLRLVASICRAASHESQGEFVSTVFVSTRSKLQDELEPGCYLRSARVVVRPGDATQTIADDHRRRIREVMQDAHVCDTCAERLALFTTRFIFNKWMLDSIRRDDGKELRVVRGGRRIALRDLLRLSVPLDVKCVCEAPGKWTLLASPVRTR